MSRSTRQFAIGALAAVLSLLMSGCVVNLPSNQQGVPTPLPGGGTPLPTPVPPTTSLPVPSLPSPSGPPPSQSLPPPGGADDPGGMPPPSGGPQEGGPQEGGPQEGGPQEGGGEGGGGGAPGGGAGGPDDGWEVSNEEVAPPSGENGAASQPEDGGESQVDALARALEELDGEILDERITTAAAETNRSPAGVEAEGSPVPVAAAAEPEIARAPTPIPPDRPDARDDDVVARQLREAAMAETDPKLREQLWEEYRRYKSGL